jgi:hypothetical protein
LVISNAFAGHSSSPPSSMLNETTVNLASAPGRFQVTNRPR